MSSTQTGSGPETTGPLAPTEPLAPTHPPALTDSTPLQDSPELAPSLTKGAHELVTTAGKQAGDLCTNVSKSLKTTVDDVRVMATAIAGRLKPMPHPEGRRKPARWTVQVTAGLVGVGVFTLWMTHATSNAEHPTGIGPLIDRLAVTTLVGLLLMEYYLRDQTTPTEPGDVNGSKRPDACCFCSDAAEILHRRVLVPTALLCLASAWGRLVSVDGTRATLLMAPYAVLVSLLVFAVVQAGPRSADKVRGQLWLACAAVGAGTLPAVVRLDWWWAARPPHAVGVALWVGGVLACCVACGWLLSTHKQHRADIVRRFSRLALRTYLIVVISGLLLGAGWIQGESLSDAFDEHPEQTDLLQWKVAFAAIFLIIGLAHEKVTLPLLAEGERDPFMFLAVFELAFMLSVVVVSVSLTALLAT